MSRLLASKTKIAFRKKIAALLEPDVEISGSGTTSIMKRPAGAGIGDAEAVFQLMKRPAGAGTDACAESMKKRPATGAVMRRPSAEDCTEIVPADDSNSITKDRNKWGFLMRNKETLDPRVLKMLEGANQRETALVANNAVRLGTNGKWEFNLDNPTMVDKLEKFEQRYQDLFDQGQPYEVAEHMWGGREKLNKALHDGRATKVEKEGGIFVKWGGFQVGTRSGVHSGHGVRAGTGISGQEAIEFSDFIKSLEFGFKLKEPERQVMVEWYTVHMC